MEIGMSGRVSLTAIELDTSIQCRAAIDTAVVSEYAERMEAGDMFPPVVLYGTKLACWIADGWHRVLAARQNGESAINAELHQGGRVDALKAALSANAAHGHRRSNADKRRCVEIALREFSKLSSRAIAEMCGVHHTFVQNQRPEPLATVANAPTVTTSDGRQYPARRQSQQPTTEPGPARDALQTGPSVADIPDKEEHELVSSHLAELKRHWGRASQADRRMFLQWIDRRKQ